ncbi:DNA-directed RNA polymerase III subunit RPC8 [Chelonia mydas]|uniref:DNA-directed RNA polymerase subunit n=1 Tax=Chelonia mydas TaxID=8469 RepID=M7C153_CHEMY|nr:DNA-directed RNA polymerase III subunit RPC8 [Chelonia mydas]
MECLLHYFSVRATSPNLLTYSLQHGHLLLAAMFVLVEMVDTVRIPPWQFEMKLNDSIAEELNKKLANKLASDEAEQVWVWEYETEEGAHDLYMDTGEEIRFRIVDESFVDTSPTGPSSTEASTSGATEEVQKKEAPYTLVVTMYNSYSTIDVHGILKRQCLFPK